LDGRASKAVCSISGEDSAKEDSNGRPKMPKYKKSKLKIINTAIPSFFPN
jgi:hypothetical protein